MAGDAALWTATWAAFNPRDHGEAGAAAAAAPPPAPAAAPPPPPPPPKPAAPTPSVSSMCLEAYVDLLGAWADPGSRRARRVAGLEARILPAASVTAALALHGCSSKGSKQVGPRGDGGGRGGRRKRERGRSPRSRSLPPPF